MGDRFLRSIDFDCPEWRGLVQDLYVARKVDQTVLQTMLLMREVNHADHQSPAVFGCSGASCARCYALRDGRHRELQASRELIRRQRDELQGLYDKLVAEQKVSERLLLNLLPSPIAERLKARPEGIADSIPEVIADSFPEATVLFADIVAFTRFSAGLSPERLVGVLNEIFTEFDTIADRRGLEKIKTIGDAYMAAAGLPEPTADHAVRAAHMALDMIDALARFNQRTGYNLQMRIGVNSGAVVAGVIGKHKFIYDLWGDAVNPQAGWNLTAWRDGCR